MECRPGPNRGNGATVSDVDPGYTNPIEEDKVNRGLKSSMWPGKVYSALYQVKHCRCYIACIILPS